MADKASAGFEAAPKSPRVENDVNSKKPVANTTDMANTMVESKSNAVEGANDAGTKTAVAKKSIIRRIKGNPTLLAAILLLALTAVGVGLWYVQLNESRVYIEQAQINAPIIYLSPSAPGVIDRILVKEGDLVHKNKIIAEVGGQSVRTQTSGIIIEVKDNPGQFISPPDYVASMVDSRDFRVVGRIEEDKGLADIRVGQRVVFTVDAFGSKEYEGVVDSISPSSRQSDIVFSISDKRAENQFNVKASFDVNAYPELKNGMSARMWVYK